MSVSTITPVSSSIENLAQATQYYNRSNFDIERRDDTHGYVRNSNSSSKNNNNNNSINPLYYHLSAGNAYMTQLAKGDDEFLLERTPKTQQTLLHKSHSYSETIRPKATILKQDSYNGRIATSLTTDDGYGDDDEDDEHAYSDSYIDNYTINTTAARMATTTASAFIIGAHQLGSSGSGGGVSINAIDDDDSDVVFIRNGDVEAQEDAFLLPDTASSSPTRRATSSKRSYSKATSSSTRLSFCYRVHAYITRNWYLSYLVLFVLLLGLMLVAYLTRDYAKRLLYWIETQNPWMIFAIFMLLFVIVSFPVVVGYFVLMITSGYLFGFFKGLLTVILGANMGIALAHVTIRSFRHRIPLHRLIKNETGRAILRVISGPRAFKVVLFTRLTPIPFGLQNAIFGVSSINPRTYHAATFLGLLPAQTINVYLGSTLRSMHEVLNSHGTAVTGYISFAVEVVCGVALMFWVVQKARKELSETLINCSTERKIIDIQV